MEITNPEMVSSSFIRLLCTTSRIYTPVFVTTVDRFDPTIDFNYLQDYLDHTIDENEFYKESFSGQDPAAYFDMPPTFGLGKKLKEDKELGQLLLKLFQEDQARPFDIDNFDAEYKTKVIKNRLHSTEGGGEVLLYNIKGIGLMELDRMSRSSNQQHQFQSWKHFLIRS